MSDELLPCPFCGGGACAGSAGAQAMTDGGYLVTYAFIYCAQCGAQTSSEPIRKAVSLWNTRAAKVGAWECRKIEEVGGEV